MGHAGTQMPRLQEGGTAVCPAVRSRVSRCAGQARVGIIHRHYTRGILPLPRPAHWEHSMPPDHSCASPQPVLVQRNRSSSSGRRPRAAKSCSRDTDLPRGQLQDWPWAL